MLTIKAKPAISRLGQPWTRFWISYFNEAKFQLQALHGHNDLKEILILHYVFNVYITLKSLCNSLSKYTLYLDYGFMLA